MIVFIWIIIVAICTLVYNLLEDKILNYFENKWRNRHKKDPK